MTDHVCGDVAGSSVGDKATVQDVVQMFRAQVEKTPEAPALSFTDQDGSVARLSYAELDLRSNVVAHRLIEAGAGPGEVVGLHADRSAELIIGLLGILKSGAAYFAIEPAYPVARKSQMAQLAGVRLELAHCAEPQITPDAERLPIEPSEPFRAEHALHPPWRASLEDPAYVVSTSGSTGAPKAVGVRHCSLANLATGLRERLAPALNGPAGKPVVAAVASVGFDAHVKEWALALCTGGRLAMMDDQQRAGQALRDGLAEHGCTLLPCTPSVLATLSVSEAPLTLESVVVGGEDCAPALLKPWVSSGREVFVVYGPAECTVDVTAGRFAGGDEVCLGTPLPNVWVTVVDASGHPVAAGEVGELLVGGAGVSAGYLGRADLTAAAFFPDERPDAPPGALVYRTGDLVRVRHDGNLRFVGRVDDQVKVRGARIEPGEVEQTLHDVAGVRQAAVVVAGAGIHQQLVAYVAVDSHSRPDIEKVRAHLRTQLPMYMVPSVITMVDDLPRTRNGKLDRAALRALPLPETQLSGDSASVAGRQAMPTSELERVVLAVWRSVLRDERLGMDADFFDQGGNSLAAVEAIAMIRERTKAPLRLKDLFKAGTAARTARRIAVLLDEDGTKSTTIRTQSRA